MWPRILNSALGIWLMAAPAVLGYQAAAATNDRIVGPLVTMAAIIAMAGATRPVRRANTAFGAWLVVAPFLLGYAFAPAVNSVLVGACVMGCSLVRGKVSDAFGGGWSSILKSRQGREINQNG